MAVKISDLPIITTATDDDYLPMVDPSSGQTRRILKSDLLKELRLGTDLALGAVKADKADFSVADSTARLAIASPFEGLTCYQKDVDANFIYDGSAWRRQAQWEELGRHTLTTTGSTLSVASFAARKYLRIIINATFPTGTVAPFLRFNNDSANNYAYAYSFSNTAEAVTLSTTGYAIQPASAAEQYGFFADIEFTNRSGQFKIVKSCTVDAFGTDASTSVNFSDIRGKYVGTGQVTRADCIIISGAGLYASGSEMIILGKD